MHPFTYLFIYLSVSVYLSVNLLRTKWVESLRLRTSSFLSGSSVDSCCSCTEGKREKVENEVEEEGNMEEEEENEEKGAEEDGM